jgi:hypothetical protein
MRPHLLDGEAVAAAPLRVLEHSAALRVKHEVPRHRRRVVRQQVPLLVVLCRAACVVQLAEGVQDGKHASAAAAEQPEEAPVDVGEQRRPPAREQLLDLHSAGAFMRPRRAGLDTRMCHSQGSAWRHR